MRFLCLVRLSALQRLVTSFTLQSLLSFVSCVSRMIDGHCPCNVAIITSRHVWERIKVVGIAGFQYDSITGVVGDFLSSLIYHYRRN